VYIGVVIEEARQFSGWDRSRPEFPGEPREKRAVPDAVEFARTRLGIEPDEKQAEVLRCEAAGMVARLRLPVRGDGDNDVSLAFPNRSRIVGLPGIEGTVRGFSAVSLLLIDEASRVEESMYRALRPMLAVGDGNLCLMSTPFRKRGFFYLHWETGGERWHRIRATTLECPRIGRDFLEEERSAQKEDFGMEYMCEFMEDGNSVFNFFWFWGSDDEGFGPED
jgi:hypothetical protein